MKGSQSRILGKHGPFKYGFYNPLHEQPIFRYEHHDEMWSFPSYRVNPLTPIVNPRVLDIQEKVHAEDPFVQHILIDDKTQTEANYSAADGLACMKIWQKRLEHILERCLKIMVDPGYVHGMILTGRKSSTCDACHVGK